MKDIPIDADVAVIIPTYNRAELLPKALDSVLAQTTGKTLDAIVIDDGSTDNTYKVMRPYLEQYGHPASKVFIRYTKRTKEGVVAARNTGLAETEAPLVAFLDSDDAWDPQKLEKQIAVMEGDTNVAVVHTSFRYVNDSDQFQDDGPQRLDNPCVGQCVDKLLDEDLVIFSSVLMRRSVIEQAAVDEEHGQPFDPRWTNGQDYDLLLRTARLGRFEYISQPLTLYRVHGGHGAMGDLAKVFGFHCKVQIDFAKRHGEALGISEEDARRRAAKFLWGRAESAFWKRHLETASRMCDVAQELGFFDEKFADLKKRASQPSWLYGIKDKFDRLIGKGHTHRV